MASTTPPPEPSRKPRNRPNEGDDKREVEQYPGAYGRPGDPTVPGEPRGVQEHIADADEAARAGSGTREDVRNTPPFGDWDDTVPH